MPERATPVRSVAAGTVAVGAIASGGVAANVAVTVVGPETVTVHGAVPEQPPPDQPLNVDPAAGWAVSSIVDPEATSVEQVEPQSIAPEADVTVPEPLPTLLTVRV